MEILVALKPTGRCRDASHISRALSSRTGASGYRQIDSPGEVVGGEGEEGGGRDSEVEEESIRRQVRQLYCRAIS